MVNNGSIDAVKTTMAHLITRTIYSPSELKSMRIMDENSAVCELLSGNREWRPGFQSIYKVAPSLYELKDKLESHLCRKTDDLFNITNRIAIFALTVCSMDGFQNPQVYPGSPCSDKSCPQGWRPEGSRSVLRKVGSVARVPAPVAGIPAVAVCKRIALDDIALRIMRAGFFPAPFF